MTDIRWDADVFPTASVPAPARWLGPSPPITPTIVREQPSPWTFVIVAVAGAVIAASLIYLGLHWHARHRRTHNGGR